MAKENRSKPGSGTRMGVTKVEDNEEEPGAHSSGIMPYVLGGLAGVAVGLLGSLLVDKAVDHIENKVLKEGVGSCEPHNCGVCLDEATPTFRTHCCNKLIHGDCLLELRKNGTTKCPYCRSSRWLG